MYGRCDSQPVACTQGRRGTYQGRPSVANADENGALTSIRSAGSMPDRTVEVNRGGGVHMRTHCNNPSSGSTSLTEPAFGEGCQG